MYPFLGTNVLCSLPLIAAVTTIELSSTFTLLFVGHHMSSKLLPLRSGSLAVEVTQIKAYPCVSDFCLPLPSASWLETMTV